MHLPSLFVLIVYVSGYVFLLFASICLACGLYYLVELAEEYTTLTKKLIRATILAHLVIHGLLFAYERFPMLQCAIGFTAHIVYLQLLKSFPFINLTCTTFILSVLLFIVDNIFWFRFFYGDVELFYNYRVDPVPAIAAFYLLVVWLVPCAFFCSLTVNDSVLPGSSNSTGMSGTSDSRYSHPNMSEAGEKKKRRNVVMLGLDYVAAAVRRILGQNSRQRDALFSNPNFR